MLGVLCGGLVGVILVVVLLRLTKKDGSIKCKYDERQQAVRGRGFKYGFFTLMFYDLVYAWIDEILGRRYFENSVGMIVGIFLGVLVYVSYCIWHEGYFSLNENPKKVLIVFAVIAIMNFAVFAVQLNRGNVIENGILTFRCVNLLCGIMFLIVFGVLLIKAICNKKEME
ncbi:MAG: hypothetical protein J6K58_16405 [Lachnospiraceae bacterium]|nr:hypothetical protein [Lachnospiraceae bacterium]